MSASNRDDATIPGEGASGPGMGPLEGWLMPGAPVGRYMVLTRLGAGGMGVVYAAYDPELDRKVALKLLRPGPGTFSGSRDREHRMLKQEAQALAKLAHPNVITIHDVGEHEGHVFLAMEFVDGQTLKQWLAERQEPDWREVLSMFRRAGEGLRAAHEQGLVHRDFKPANVMVGNDGRVRVMDFGLARSAALLDEAEPTSIVGTPAYMAPEQLMGTAIDARSDQFSFCVALWEGLHGERPFAGDTATELLSSFTQSSTPIRGRRGPVPGWVHRAVLMGLAVEPARRHASMEGLLQALRRAPSRARLRLATAATVVALAGGGWGAVAWTQARTLAACEAEGRRIEADWTAERRARVELAILGHDVSFAPETWERVAPRLDEYAEGWRLASEAACTAHRVDRRWSETMAMRASECLQERRAAFGSLVDVLAHVDLDGLLLASGTVGSLPALEACRDEGELGRRSPPHAADQERWLGVRTETIRAGVEWRAGRQAAGQTRLEDALAEAEALDDPELVALVEGEMGELLLTQGDYEGGAALVRRVYFDRGAHGDQAGQVAPATTLARIEAEHLGHLDLAQSWLEHAQMLHARTRGPEAAEPVTLTRARAILLAERGEYEGAIELAVLALRRAEETLGLDHPSVEPLASTVADIEVRRGSFAAALAITREGLARQRRVWGDHHPEIARTLANLATIQATRGELDAAQAYAEQAVALAEQSLGPDHRRTADALRALARVQSSRGQLDAAIAGYERALVVLDRSQPMEALAVRTTLGGLLVQHGEHARAVALLETVLEAQRTHRGPDSPELLNVLVNLGAAQRGLEHEDAAASSYREALRVGEASLPPDHPSLAFPLNNLGSIERSRGDLPAARQLLSRALEIRRAKLGDAHPLVASTLDTLAMVDLDERRPRVAVTRLEQARAILLAKGADPLRRAQIELHLARALQAAGGELERALALAVGSEHVFTTLERETDRAEAEALRRELEAPARRGQAPAAAADPLTAR
jgi:tetratricopeptide (TPR) repeat protein/predicted Ser/Thr protein kinase